MSGRRCTKDGGISAARVREAVSYDPATGEFRWRSARAPHVPAGCVAGTLKKDSGYVLIGIDGTQYRAHRLAWLYVFDEWPNGVIDHINGNRADNRIANLRAVTDAVNIQNRRGPQADNKLGVLGVFKCKGRYQAQVKLNRKITHIGTFDTPEEAHAAYLRVKRELHEGCTL